MARRTTPHRAASETDLVAQVVDYALFTLDVEGHVRSWNAGAERLKGYRSDEIQGRSFRTFYPPEDQESGLPDRLLQQARDEGRVEHEGWRVRRDGSRFWGNVVITALHDEHGELTGFLKVTRDLTEQHRLIEELRRSEERFRVMVSQVVDYAIVGLDPDGFIDTWNAGAERLKGYAADEIVGRHFSVFYAAEDREAGLPATLLGRALEVGRVEHEGWRVRRDGSRFWGDVVITALHDDAGEVRGFVKVTRDLTDRKLLEEAQDSFYATFEHDFRNPVAAIRGASEALAKDPGEERRGELLERIRTNADRLLAMTGELVEYARLRSGSTTLHLEVLDLVALATETVAGLGVVTEGGRVRLDGGCESIEADRVSVERIIVNLVGNALRYSDPGTVVEVRCDPGPPGFSRLTVRDRGRGIAARDLPHIFTEFERGPLARDDGGVGLGLASVKKLVAANGGRIVVESEVGSGTTVAVDFPHRA
ncbi:PAS domain-containing sensor histidine kinase [Nocardioides sp. HDW12B]|uniref:PAS domain-containing sensor histidine kinase n=1 Tax=Nocardioides sp. HDW12B TaxID=2714939 RepID=UPI00140873FF|nr:PAS domain-containing sensor histidine kinase [Nocardioides sp. HDW12B]QIK68191.1 PAS domain-containing sensor histidine kinase [Nocardioides sp. HDW12B]